MTFDIGDYVRWDYQGIRYTGMVVAVVEAGQRPADYPSRKLYPAFEHLDELYSRHGLGGGSARNSVSYLVAAPNRHRPKSKPKLRWPRACWLKPAHPLKWWPEYMRK